MTKMNPALREILAHKRVEVAKAKMTTPLQTLERVAAQTPPARNFFAAVVDEHLRNQPRVIAEIKQRSPSGGLLRERFDPVRIAEQYADAGAAAISCLTDERFFGGHLGYIQQIKSVAPLPVLRKDFVVDQYQIWEARAANADAILLISEILTEGEMLDMMILAQRLGMTTLVEAHSVENLLRVQRHIGFPHAGYSLLGINNRNLESMETDLGHTFRMLELVDNTKVLVSESGIRSRDDVIRLRQHGINIILVGEQLLRKADPGDALRELLGQPASR